MAAEDSGVSSDELRSEEGFDCRTLDSGAPPDTALEWFERSLWAGHCYVFDANAVRIGHDGVRTLALTHEIQDGVERGVAHFLDGPALVVERRGRIGRLSWAGDHGNTPSSPAGIAAHLDGLYRLQLGGQERIANRHTQRLDIAPLDSLRFGHRLWLDMATGLPLKQTLLDETGRVVETFQFTEFTDAYLYQGNVVFDHARPPPEDPWVAGWLPKGFMPQPVDTRSARHDEQVVHRLYSDGLSTLSLFVEPLGSTDVLAPGLHRLGVSHAAVRHRELGGEVRQVVVMGELPPRVLLRVADTLEWQGES
ncbi:MucB/RseB C-terminal domain-containing protein [Halomonas urumqiensis]|uniref:Negative regulator for alginate biosynthesis MucB n=2 Tax=Halomonas urumqiensis TaxID=1684789 RepID=A0A2N7UR15_9GAMM|nr:MucB/RseB C-terminal domain-containing protein [Halomonas urumqiensis]PMR82887.1 negative regulator for alginate biosynthesis MucB [Halomonas urumqiensis]PTB01997.1 negative regulator for alginate biosynthesis MucB [Halomonas urumqiensis]